MFSVTFFHWCKIVLFCHWYVIFLSFIHSFFPFFSFFFFLFFLNFAICLHIFFSFGSSYKPWHAASRTWTFSLFFHLIIFLQFTICLTIFIKFFFHESIFLHVFLQNVSTLIANNGPSLSWLWCLSWTCYSVLCKCFTNHKDGKMHLYLAKVAEWLIERLVHLFTSKIPRVRGCEKLRKILRGSSSKLRG